MEWETKRFSEELRIRGYSPRTVESYARAVDLLLRWSRRHPRQLDMEEVRRYLVYLKDQGLSPSTINQAVCAARIFFLRILERPWDPVRIGCHRRPRKLPVVLTRDEVARAIEAARGLRSRTLLMTLYSTAVRVSELTNLQVRDIDSASKRVHIRSGKGAKDRFAPLSERLLDQLRSYWRAHRPRHWLFPGPQKQHPIGQRSVQRICNRAGWCAGLQKRVTPHVFRHSCATHLLESGVPLPYIQQILGHSSIKTTLIYTRVTPKALSEVVSPLDRLSLGPLDS